MKFLSTLLVGLLALSIISCENPETQKPQADDNNNQLVNETDYSVCHNSPAPHSIEGTWYMRQAQGPIHFVSTFQFANNAVRLTNDCAMNGMTLRAQVTVPALYDGMLFQPLKPAYDVKNIENANFKMSCEASISTTKINYSFDGNCLVFAQTENADRMVLVPQY